VSSPLVVTLGAWRALELAAIRARDVASFHATLFCILFKVELNCLPFSQGFETIRLDARPVDKVLSSILALDKAKALVWDYRYNFGVAVIDFLSNLNLKNEDKLAMRLAGIQISS
jgi:hypothetical protein